MCCPRVSKKGDPLIDGQARATSERYGRDNIFKATLGEVDLRDRGYPCVSGFQQRSNRLELIGAIGRGKMRFWRRR